MRYTGSYFRAYECKVADDHMPEIVFRAHGLSAADALEWALQKARILTGESDFDQVSIAFTGETCPPFDRRRALDDLTARVRKKRWSLSNADLNLGDVGVESVVSNLPERNAK